MILMMIFLKMLLANNFIKLKLLIPLFMTFTSDPSISAIQVIATIAGIESEDTIYNLMDLQLRKVNLCPDYLVVNNITMITA